MRTLSQNWVLAALAATWLAAQNVGIGTTTPGAKLDVYGGNGTYIRVSGAMPAGDGNPGLVGYELVNTSAGGLWRMYLADPDGGYGVVPRSFEIWEYPANLGPGGCCRPRLRILSSHGLANPAEVVIDPVGNVGIGTTAPHSAAILQLQATDKGFLPTQVALTSATSWSPLVGAPVNGMLVYNTATAGIGQNAVSPGYYYWRDGRWRRFTENAYAGAIRGVLAPPGQNLTSNCHTYQYLDSYIDLPPGKWIVYSVQLLNPSFISTTGSIWVRTTLSDNSSCNPASSSDIIGAPLISGLLPHDAPYSLVNGQIFINNTSGSVKRYYYCGCRESYNGYNANLVNFSTTGWGENQLYALPAE